mmetsp:Transcript_14809/g.35807  ORF Transcript_14809/g.35807 Transcript_14809/m.35807 type:complete len:455 (+) Transcript_14809:110-1474(+)
MLLHSTASHSPTIRKERRIEAPSNGKSLTKANPNKKGIIGSDWEMPTSKSPLNEKIEPSIMGAEHEMGTNNVSTTYTPSISLESQSDEFLKTPEIFQKKNYEITEDDDECDVPELIAEDSMEPTLRLDILHPQPASAASASPPIAYSAPSLQGLFAAQPSADTHHLKTTTPTNSILKTSSTAATPLSSCLKKKKKSPKSALKSPNFHTPTPRRVRGLWDDNNTTTSSDDTTGQKKITLMKKNKIPSAFSQLREETIIHCLSFLSGGEPKDLLAVSQVGRRFNSLVTTSLSLWKTVDATNFVHNVYHNHHQQQQSNHQSATASETTTKALAKLLLKYPPETLIIRDIGHKLQADESFLPPAGRLKNLTLTHFQGLTDTHVHVLLLLLALPSNKQQQQQQQRTAPPLIYNNNNNNIITKGSSIGRTTATDAHPLHFMSCHSFTMYHFRTTHHIPHC